MTVSESSMGVDEREIIVNETGLIAFVGKTRAARRRIPMTPRVTAITNSRIASSADSWIFSAPTRSGHMEGSSVRKQQTRVFSVTGIKPFELYCLRHTCLTRWAPKMDPLHAGLSCWPQRHFDYEALCSPRRRDHQSRNDIAKRLC